MRKKDIKIQVKSDAKSAKRALRGFMKNKDQDKLHQFRVSIKKLRAVASLIEQTTPLMALRRELKPVKATYQLSGQVRDSYLHVKLAKKMPGAVEKYIMDEKLVMKKATGKLRRNKSVHLKMLGRARRRLLKQIPKVQDKKVSEFYERELRSVAACLSTSNEMEQLHDCRKRLKVLLYNLPLVKGTLDFRVNDDYLQEVQRVIGDWHDYVLAAEQFPELSEKAAQLMQEVNIRTDNFYKRVTSSTPPLIKKGG
jgi:CHAD domain-containing protein